MGPGQPVRDPSSDQPQPPRKRSRRLLVLLLSGATAITATALFTSQTGNDDEAVSASPPAEVVYHIKRKPPSPALRLEYHFDRNAVADSRMLGQRIVGLVDSGNLLAFDKDTFALRRERILRRRATCLGPNDGNHLFVGIANGTIVRVGGDDLAFAHVTSVPGTPVWIGKRERALVIAYKPEPGPEANVLVRDDGENGRTYEVGVEPLLFLDSKHRLWIAGHDKVERLDLASNTRETIPLKVRSADVRGFAELSSGHVWAFGGSDRRGEMGSFVARVWPGPQALLLSSARGRPRGRGDSRPTTPITHIVESTNPPRLFVVSREGVFVSDASLATWRPFDLMGAYRRDQDALVAKGQAHLVENKLVLAVARGGFLEVTADFSRRHRLEKQNTVLRPSEIVRLADGMAFYGSGGPIFYSGGVWRSLPDAILPPAELVGPARSGESERQWAAVRTIPIEGGGNYVIAKAGPPRHYVGHLHGLRDVVVTARWDGNVLSVLGREALPIEPDDTFATPNRELWNIDDQGLWSFSGGRWRLVIRASAWNAGTGGRPEAGGPATVFAPSGLRPGMGERLHFRMSSRPPFYGLPSGATSWALVRLDSNEAGGVPLIDEVPVKVAGRRLLLYDLSSFGKEKDELLLATDHGLGVFNVKYGTCEILRPEGLGGEVRLFMRDGTKRLWLGGGGLWVLRDREHADIVHPSIPMLSDTRVVALAETTDGRIVIGTEDRGSVFVAIPPGWLQKANEAPVLAEEWEKTGAHEPAFLDPGVVLRACGDKDGRTSDAAQSDLVAALRKLTAAMGPRMRVATEGVFEGQPDLAVRGAEPDKLVEEILPLVEKLESKAGFSVHKRFGPRGSATVEVRPCPPR